MNIYSPKGKSLLPRVPQNTRCLCGQPTGKHRVGNEAVCDGCWTKSKSWKKSKINPDNEAAAEAVAIRKDKLLRDSKAVAWPQWDHQP